MQLRAYLEASLVYIKEDKTDWDVVFDSCTWHSSSCSKCRKNLHPERKWLYGRTRSATLGDTRNRRLRALRSINGAKQPLRVFQTDFQKSTLTEEGLAMLAEEKNNLLAKNTLADQTHIVRGHIDRAGFRELYEQLKLCVGPRMS